jgi:hypothetical protein
VSLLFNVPQDLGLLGGFLEKPYATGNAHVMWNLKVGVVIGQVR